MSSVVGLEVRSLSLAIRSLLQVLARDVSSRCSCRGWSLCRLIYLSGEAYSCVRTGVVAGLLVPEVLRVMRPVINRNLLATSQDLHNSVSSVKSPWRQYTSRSEFESRTSKGG
ncbi:hypothetical protein K474DRAFT_1661028 [Panus rudis PR-1116 ss-1]|nr:hypothetical protein K474DRAFT_1661028 [Panus rudis PR-1116 ss-1]